MNFQNFVFKCTNLLGESETIHVGTYMEALRWAKKRYPQGTITHEKRLHQVGSQQRVAYSLEEHFTIQNMCELGKLATQGSVDRHLDITVDTKLVAVISAIYLTKVSGGDDAIPYSQG